MSEGRLSQSEYHVSFIKHGPLWFWRGWNDGDDEWSSPWGRGVSLSKQAAIWAARRRMIGRIVKAHARQGTYFVVDGDELVRLADLPHLEDPDA